VVSITSTLQFPALQVEPSLPCATSFEKSCFFIPPSSIGLVRGPFCFLIKFAFPALPGRAIIDRPKPVECSPAAFAVSVGLSQPSFFPSFFPLASLVLGSHFLSSGSDCRHPLGWRKVFFSPRPFSAGVSDAVRRCTFFAYHATPSAFSRSFSFCVIHERVSRSSVFERR